MHIETQQVATTDLDVTNSKYFNVTLLQVWSVAVTSALLIHQKYVFDYFKNCHHQVT
jgi:hypothetical protein